MPPTDTSPLSEAEEAADAVGSWLVCMASLREMHQAGWQPPEGSPFRAREEVE